MRPIIEINLKWKTDPDLRYKYTLNTFNIHLLAIKSNATAGKKHGLFSFGFWGGGCFFFFSLSWPHSCLLFASNIITYFVEQEETNQCSLFSTRNSMTTELKEVHSIMASATAMLKRDQDILLVPKQFEKCQNCDAKFLLSRRCFRQTNPAVVTLIRVVRISVKFPDQQQ